MWLVTGRMIPKFELHQQGRIQWIKSTLRALISVLGTVLWILWCSSLWCSWTNTQGNVTIKIPTDLSVASHNKEHGFWFQRCFMLFDVNHTLATPPYSKTVPPYGYFTKSPFVRNEEFPGCVVYISFFLKERDCWDHWTVCSLAAREHSFWNHFTYRIMLCDQYSYVTRFERPAS